MYLGIVVNPKARKNLAAPGDRSAALRRIVGAWGEVHETASVEDLRNTVQQLCPRVTHLVGDGGDGSLHWLINEVRQCDADPQHWPTFVPTNHGSVNAVARKARVRGKADAIVRALVVAAESDRPPPEVCLDMLELDGETADGAPFHRLCFGLAAGGVGNRFYDKYYANPDHGRAAVARVIGRMFGDYITSKVAPGDCIGVTGPRTCSPRRTPASSSTARRSRRGRIGCCTPARSTCASAARSGCSPRHANPGAAISSRRIEAIVNRRAASRGTHPRHGSRPAGPRCQRPGNDHRGRG
ncbi:diacylglycerol kinase catalytic domain protein [Mycobacterium xenopi 4042]|uniref:Diacylglycerol kinase catalytic domain protein n=1 Tax=Mycobacterium xenopi 4042 TaxID=1299334 RepID=X8CF67_MYCXE|nr:diacylglycerol kinase catalytic domain protein [Mycobacterium xenopi 4042]